MFFPQVFFWFTLDLPWLPLPPFAFIFMIAPCLSLSLSPPCPPITCLSTRLGVSLQTEFAIFASFSKPQAWLRGAVVEIVQVCSFTFFRACHFTILPFPTQLSDRGGLIGITSVLCRPDFSFAFENININTFSW